MNDDYDFYEMRVASDILAYSPLPVIPSHFVRTAPYFIPVSAGCACLVYEIKKGSDTARSCEFESA